MRKIIILPILLFFCLPAKSQQDLYNWKIKGYAGGAHYYNVNADAAEYIKYDDNIIYQLEIGKTLNNTFGISLSSTFGNIKGLDYESNSFQTETRMGSLRLYFYMDNGWLLNSSATIAPYLYGGFGLNKLKTQYGLLSIESSNNSVFPFGCGVKFRVSERVNFDIQGEAVYGYDNHLAVQELEQNKNNSIYLHAGLALSYSFGFKKTTFTAPRFYAGDASIELINDSNIVPNKNLVETILKVEPKEPSKSVIVKGDSIQPNTIETIPSEPKKKRQSKEIIPSDSVQLRPGIETVETIIETTDTTFEDKIVVKDSTITLEGNVILSDSLLSGTDSLMTDSVHTHKLKPFANDTVFVITDSTSSLLLDTTLRVIAGDSVVRKVTKLKTTSGLDSIVVKELVIRTIKDTTITKIVPIVRTVRDTVRVIKQVEPDTSNVQRDNGFRNNFVPDTVFIEQEPTPELEKEFDNESAERTPVDYWDEEEPQKVDDYEKGYTSERNDDYRYNQPSVTSTYEKSVIEKTIYVPQDISGGYIIGVKPNSQEREPDTLKYDVVKSYFDSLALQNRALMNMVDSLQRVVAGDSSKIAAAPSSVIYYTPAENSNSESNQLLLDYIDRQAAYNDQMRAKFDTLESELARIRLANATLNMETKEAAELKVLNDSIARLNKLLEKPAPKIVTPAKLPETTVYFKTGSNAVPAENYNELQEIVKAVKKAPELKIQLAGYSDLSGNPKTNLILSRKRAEAVSLHLQKLGVVKSRILIQYFGDTKAVEQSNPLDRKVEVQIISK